MAREWLARDSRVTTVCVEPDLISMYLTNQGGMGTCIARLMEIFKRITPEDNGGFFLWDGTRMERQPQKPSLEGRAGDLELPHHPFL